MRSRTGCKTCRARKLKCDETRPTCAVCIKSNRDCVYAEPSIFRVSDVQSIERTNQEKSPLRSGKDRDSGNEQIPTWVAIPPDLHFVQVDDPYASDDSELPTAIDSARNLIEEQGVNENMLAADSTVHASHASLQVESSQSTSSLSPGIDVRFPPTEDQIIPPHDSVVQDNLDHNVVVVRLVRHFKHGPGQWMDLFDTTAYFSSKVPIIAGTKPLLKDALCALAAKHLQHCCKICNLTKSVSPVSSSYYIKETGEPDWRYYSMRYYHQALGHLKASVASGHFNDDHLAKEEIFAAVAILCTYELMDAPGTAWRAHLSALPLFSRGVSSTSEPSEIIIPKTTVKGPAFWSLARQDLLCAFISETPTRLDSKDVTLWQNAGLVTNRFGSLFPCNPENSISSQTRADVEEDTKCNELTWLLGKIANHLTAGDALNIGHDSIAYARHSPIGLSQEHLLYRWRALMNELDNWLSSLPPTFTTSARTRLRISSGDSEERNFSGYFEQVWYDLPLCAAAMQSYHQAKILLLVNEPHESTALRSTVYARLVSYRRALAEAEWHAREIYGISLADPTDAVRINSVQALFVAGQVLEVQDEQNMILRLLGDIEAELGWTTKYHVIKLTEDWAKQGSNNHVDRQQED